MTKHGSWKLETFRLPKIWKPTSPTWTKSITKLPLQAHSLVNKQTTTFSSLPAPPPLPPNSMLVSGSRTVSWQASLPTSKLHKGEGGGEEEVNVVELRREKQEVSGFLAVCVRLSLHRGRGWEGEANVVELRREK